MISILKRFCIEAEDWVRYHPAARGALCRWQLLKARGRNGDDPPARVGWIARLCAAAEVASDAPTMRKVEDRILEQVRLLGRVNGGLAPALLGLKDRRLVKAAILKPRAGPREKGVLFVSFEKQWARLLGCPDLDEFARRYHLVVSPSWSPPHSPINYLFPAAFPAPVFSLISDADDLRTLPRLSPNYVVVPLYASSWVNPELFQPLPPWERDTDVVMVANFGKFKRHHVLFRALREMPPGLRVLLIGQDQDGRTAATIRAEARCYGVEGPFEVRSNLSHEEVSRALCRSRVSVNLSRQEGSCVVVAESLFADTPVALLEGAVVGSRAFINPATGRFVTEKDLGRQLLDFLAGARAYSARRWAEENISCFRSTGVLNDALKGHALRSGQEWTKDLAPMCWRPDPLLVRDQDRRRVEADLRDIRDRFGLEIGPPTEAV